MEEHKIHIMIETTRTGFWWEARELRPVLLEEAPCGHEECREQVARGPVIRRGLNPRKVTAKAAFQVMRERVQQMKDAADRAASEALGG